jgi:hypothetical protein
MNVTKLCALAACLFCSALVAADPPPPTGAQLVTALLREFIGSAGRQEPELYDRFFADDVLYTRSTGATATKTTIMESVRGPKSDDKSTYSAEDIVVHDYGDTVVVAFRLEAQIEKDGTMQPAHFRDTGTFVRRNGRWQVVAWQATKVADPPAAH